MEEAKKAEGITEYFQSEIPPIFKSEIPAKKEKNTDSIILFRVTATALIIVSLVVLKVFFPDVYVVLDSWFTEKNDLLSLLK